MPRARPVDRYARRYQGYLAPPECHGLVPWIVTLVATTEDISPLLNATGLSRGLSRSFLGRRSSNERETSTGQARGILPRPAFCVVETSVRPPRDKPVASSASRFRFVFN